MDESAELIIYRQKTWYNIDDKKGKTLHVESGFLKIVNGTCQLINSQGNGRTEVMNALYFTPGANKRIYFISQHFSNDPRMIQSRRDIIVKDDTLTYELKMSTNKVSDIQTHLFSILKKTG